jgi:hypothetical protein
MKNNIKTSIFIPVLPLLLFAFTACQDRLVEENHSNLTQEFMKTPKGFEMGLSSVYSTMKTMYGYEEGIHGLMNPGTDEMKSNIGGGNRTSNMAQYHLENYNTDNEYPRKLWQDAYVNINTLNYLIENADVVDVSTQALTPAKRDQYLGEALFLRAFFYFNLVTQFGDVTLTTTYNTEPATSATRHDMIEVYDVIISDLIEAARLCSPSPQQNSLQSGRASGAAVRHLLAKAYLTLGWVYDKSSSIYPGNTHNKYYDAGKAQEYYKLAYDTAEKLITDASSLGISLMPNFADIFNETNDAPSGRNKEELFVARMDWDEDNIYGARSTLNHYYVNGYDAYLGERNINDGRCYSWNNPNSYAYDAFTQRDIDTRYAGTFQTVWYATRLQNGGEVRYAIGGTEETFQWKLTEIRDTAMYYPGYRMTAEQIRRMTQNRGEGKNQYLIFTPDSYNGRNIFPTITKFLDRTRAVPNDNSDRSIVVFRLGETCLLAAEAAFKLNRGTDAARYINLIRERARNKETSTAGALDITESDITLDYILEERTRELMAEHCRWADLVRTGTLIERVRKYDEGPAAINIQDRHMLRPVPRRQVDRITTGEPYPQNPGW